MEVHGETSMRHMVLQIYPDIMQLLTRADSLSATKVCLWVCTCDGCPYVVDLTIARYYCETQLWLTISSIFFTWRKMSAWCQFNSPSNNSMYPKIKIGITGCSQAAGGTSEIYFVYLDTLTKAKRSKIPNGLTSHMKSN